MEEKEVNAGLLCENEIYDFLVEIDPLFVVPLSHKTELRSLAAKFTKKGSVFTERVDGHIVSMVAGYTENLTNSMAYISVVATLPTYEKQGCAKKLVREFIETAAGKHCRAVHLYTHPTNTKAIRMYESLGFKNWDKLDEARPGDVHLIYLFT